MEFKTVTVSVPELKVADLLRYAADLADITTDTTNGSSQWTFEELVQSAYVGGQSNVWRPMLEFLADRPDEWVDWSDIYTAMNRTARQMSGAIGAAERRCHGHPPYEKRMVDGKHQFRMTQAAADIIHDAAETLSEEQGA